MGSKEKLMRLTSLGLFSIATAAGCGAPANPKPASLTYINGYERSIISRVSDNKFLIGQQAFWRDTELNVSIQGGVMYMRNRGCEITNIITSASSPAQVEVKENCLIELK